MKTEAAKIIHREYCRMLRLAFPGQENEYRKKLYSKDPSKKKDAVKRWTLNHPEQSAEMHRIASLKYESNNKEHRRSMKRVAKKIRLATDPNYKLLENLRSRMHAGLKGRCKFTNSRTLIGCSIEDLWIYLESKFETGMTRENYGPVWHVDHIVPCAIFDFTKKDHQRRCFHFSNLQPMFAAENIAKRAKFYGTLPLAL